MSDAAAGSVDDVRWFEALYASHYDDLLRFAARRAGLVAAPDIVADVFMIAWRRRAVVKRDTERLWLFGVARKVVANALRVEDRRSRLAEQLRHDPALRRGSSEPPDLMDVVVAAVNALPPREREALMLTEWEQLDIGDAATVAGCSTATFRVRLHRARRRIAGQLAHAETATDINRNGAIR